MALPTFTAQGAIARGTGAITPAIPASAVTGDIFLLFVETGGGTAGADPSITDPAGGAWTAIGSSIHAGTTPETDPYTKLMVFWSRYNGTQTDPSVSDTGNHQTARILGFRGVRAYGNPYNITSTDTEAASDTSGSVAGATTTVNDCLVVIAITSSADPAANGTAGFSSWTNADLANVTERSDMQSTTGTGGDLGVATGEKATAGAYGATTVTLADAGYKAGITIALAPEFNPTASLSSPADGGTVGSTTPDLSFSGSDGNTDDILTYEIQVASESSFGSRIYTANNTWLCPQGVTSVTVEAYGGGGGGRTDTTNGGGGGGGGAYSSGAISVTAGNSYAIVVGTGGTAGLAGGDSYFDAGATVKAKGGSGSTGTSGAAGGAAASGAGTNKHSGGTGGNFNSTKGGGGGGGAGSAVDGNNGVLDVGGSGVASNAGANGGKGGDGAVAGSGNPGLPYGGGGAGGTKTAGTVGGTGSDGAVILTFNSILIDKYSGGNNTQTYTSNNTWIAPAGVNSVDAEGWGAGGGGGGSNNSSDTQAGGGGGGAFAKKYGITVTPSTGYTVTVGAAGTGGAAGNPANDGVDGGSSKFNDGSSDVMIAIGGSGGKKGTASVGAGGAGGTTAASTGDVKYSGGAGSAGNGISSGGAGGGGAGSAGNGGDASGSTGGTAGNPDGGAGSNTNANNPGAPGGGGDNIDWTGSGHNGARGQVKVTYGDGNFTDVTSGTDVDPFLQGDTIKYTVQAANALTLGSTYYWRVRVKDRLASNTWSSWTTARSFTVSAVRTTDFFHFFPLAR